MKRLKMRIINIGYLMFLFISPNFLTIYKSFAQESYKLNEMEINRNINLEDENNRDFPTNPFEIVDRIMRSSSMDDATKPSEAIDEAIKSFDIIKEEK